LKRLIATSLASTCWADKHQTMAHLNSVVKLYNFELEELNVLEIFYLASLIDGLEQVSVFLNRLFYSWEKIGNNVLKKWKILT